MKCITRIAIAAFLFSALTDSTLLSQTAPVITGIKGYKDSVGVVDGRWTGQPTVPPLPAGASNKYIGCLAYDIYDSATQKVVDPKSTKFSWSSYGSYWEVIGSNFGPTPGTITISQPEYSSSLVSWSDKSIIVKVVGPTVAMGSARINVTPALTTQNPKPRPVWRDESVVATIAGRGFGQCTYLVARTCLTQGRTIPPKAYTNTALIPQVGAKVTETTGYKPTQWDCMNYDGKHVSIITSVPVPTSNQKDGSISWQFTVSEFNAIWNEDADSFKGKTGLLSSSRTYNLGPADKAGVRVVQSGIGSNSGYIATGYYRPTKL